MERERERSQRRESKRAPLPNVTQCHMFQTASLLELDMRAALNNHLHIGQGLIKTTLCLFGNCKSERKQKWATFTFTQGRNHVHVHIQASRQQFSPSLRDVWKLFKESEHSRRHRLSFLCVSLHWCRTGIRTNQCRNTRACFLLYISCSISWGCTSPVLKGSWNGLQLHIILSAGRK